ncbi:MAG: flagellar protein FlaG [Candidatus Omnitrophica bacterium]|nr:flagellar protein FlaG [Candidatus Omnitrophota bacterium]
MITNSTTSLEPKTGYTQVERAKPTPPAFPGEESRHEVSIKPETDKVVLANTATPSAVDQEELSKKQQEELKQKVTEAIPKVREVMQKNQRSLNFEVAEKENRVIITVIDRETEQVIRQIPPEDVLKIAEAINQGLEDSLGGLMLNSKA